MEKNRKSFGYCAVTADFIHIGHLNLFKACKERCEQLIVGIMTDACVEKYKGRKPIMSTWQRKELVESLSIVDVVHIQETFEFPHSVLRLKEFHGEDFIVFDNEQHNRDGADVLIPYMEGLSSSGFKKEYMA